MASGDEKSIWADMNYRVADHKRAARKAGIYYGVLDKPARATPLTNRQKQRNRKKSRVRKVVEHAFGFMRKKLKVTVMRARNLPRNTVAFEMRCTIYNVLRTSFLLRRQCV